MVRHSRLIAGGPDLRSDVRAWGEIPSAETGAVSRPVLGTWDAAVYRIFDGSPSKIGGSHGHELHRRAAVNREFP